MSSATVVVTLVVVLVGLACVFGTVRSRRWHKSREQSYPDHVRRSVQAHRRGRYSAGEPQSVVDPPPWAPVSGGVFDDDARTSQLLEELFAIAQSRRFLTMQGEDPRTREIGAELDGMNGMKTMRDVHRVVRAELGSVHARELEVTWDGIGRWRG